MQVKTKANELIEAKVSHVSLVKRGANRIPFRITKAEENQMFDLSKLFKAEAPKAPIIAAVLVSKSFDMEAAKRRIEAAGFSVAKSSEADTGTIFSQKEDGTVPAANAVILKLDDNFGLAIENVDVKKMFEGYNFESTSFKEMVSQEGLFGSMMIAKDALGTTVSNILMKADSPASAAELVKKAIGEFGDYMFALVSAVPTTAFKMEDPEVIKKMADPEKDPDMANEDEEAKKKKPPVEEAKKTEAAPDAKATETVKSEQEQKPAPSAATTDVVKAEDDASKGLAAIVAKALEPIANQIAELSKSQGETRKVLDAQGLRVEEVAKSVPDAVKKAMGQTVAASAPEDRAETSRSTATTRKSEGGPVDSEGFLSIDTAYGRPD